MPIGAGDPQFGFTIVIGKGGLMDDHLVGCGSPQDVRDLM